MSETETAYVTFVEPQPGVPGELRFEDKNGVPWHPTVEFGVTQSFEIMVKPGTQAIHLRSLTFWFENSHMARTFQAGLRGAGTLEYGGVSIEKVDTSASTFEFSVKNNLAALQDGLVEMEVTVESGVPGASGRYYTSRDPQITLQANQGGTGGGGGGPQA